jgi:hypothetical protein
MVIEFVTALAYRQRAGRSLDNLTTAPARATRFPAQLRVGLIGSAAFLRRS